MAVSNITELAQTLSDNERKALLDKIQKSLQITHGDERDIYHHKSNEKEREMFIFQDKNRMGIWERFILWLRSIFSTKTKDQVFIEYKLEKIQHRIDRRTANLVDTTKRELPAEFGRRVFKLYSTVRPFIHIYDFFWKNTKYLRGLIEFILEKRIPDSRTSLYRFIAFEELRDMFLKIESKSNIREYITKELEKYLDNIPDEIFTEIELGILPIYHLKDLILYPYFDMFSKFSFETPADGETDPVFSSAKIELLMNELESLYYAIYSARKGKNESLFDTELSDFYNTMRTKIGDQDQALQHPEMFMETPDWKKQFRLLYKELEDFHAYSKIADIIRFSRKDPYYRFFAYIPQLNIREFYASALQLKILTELDEQYSNIRLEVVKALKQEIFHQNPPGFEFYKRNLLPTSSRLPIFRYVDSLNTLYQFGKQVFLSEYHELLRLIIRFLPERYREIQSNLNFSVAGLEDLVAQIRNFDYSFSPSSDEGKDFLRLKYNAEKDLSQNNALRVILAQKDKDAKVLLERGHENLKAISDTISQLQGEVIDHLGERLTGFLPGMQDGGFELRLEEVTNSLYKVQKVLIHEQIIEEGN